MHLDRPTLCILQDLLHPTPDKLVELNTERIPEHGVSNDLDAPEVGVLPNALGPVNDLIGNNKVSRGNVFPQRSYSRKRNDRMAANVFESCNVGPDWDFGGRDGVAFTMTSDEGDEGARWEG